MKDSKIKLIAIIGIIMLGICLIGYYIYQNVGGATVSATGNAEMTVDPDKAVIYVLIQTEDDSAENAKNENAEIYDEVLTALIKVGIEMKDIETQNYNINPIYNWTGGTREIIGYRVSNNMEVSTDDFNNVGKIVDASVDNGALVSYINFELSTEKTNEYKAMVLAEASQDARKKAESVASGLGKKVGGLVSVTTSDYNYYPYRLYEAGEAKEDVQTVATNIQPQNLDISASVTATFRIR